MVRHSRAQTLMAPVWAKVLVCVWMFVVVFIYLLLFGPPEFWVFIQRTGYQDLFQSWASWLQQFFMADYLS